MSFQKGPVSLSPNPSPCPTKHLQLRTNKDLSTDSRTQWSPGYKLTVSTDAKK